MSITIKKYFKKVIPFYSYVIKVYWSLKRLLRRLSLSLLPRSYIFKRYYLRNKWGCEESKSGAGSSIEETRIIRNELQKIISEYQIKSLLDAPCGDFNWMQHVNLEEMEYIGVDIVSELIEENNKQYKKNNIKFMRLDFCSDSLPDTDIILCRDALVHLSNKDVLAFFLNLRKSQIKYLLTTTFPEITTNTDIVTGMWRPINLCFTPFNLPAPIKIFEEGYNKENIRGQDKSMGLWEIKNI